MHQRDTIPFSATWSWSSIHPTHLARRLRELGVPIRAGRSSALSALAHRIPAPVAAELLGLSAKTTAKASVELKVDYAA